MARLGMGGFHPFLPGLLRRHSTCNLRRGVSLELWSISLPPIMGQVGPGIEELQVLIWEMAHQKVKYVLGGPGVSSAGYREIYVEHHNNNNNKYTVFICNNCKTRLTCLPCVHSVIRRDPIPNKS